ncbi:hypothetical protein [Dyadobacter sp. CY347]|uniref:ABC transporter permease n=1 Tax=Dyadobacter sp. CY347 TaxID=2909336 RepID=UPI001F3195ED|nr:hypothetical protein [Dyadobacter sp. CY347]
MLTQDFLILIIIAICIAFPMAWWLMHQWLQSFAYHVSMGWRVFAVTGLIMVIITLATIGYQSLNAALMNPTDALKAN